MNNDNTFSSPCKKRSVSSLLGSQRGWIPPFLAQKSFQMIYVPKKADLMKTLILTRYPLLREKELLPMNHFQRQQLEGEYLEHEECK
jgi:hypothetical protein